LSAPEGETCQEQLYNGTGTIGIPIIELDTRRENRLLLAILGGIAVATTVLGVLIAGLISSRDRKRVIFRRGLQAMPRIGLASIWPQAMA